MLYFSQLSFAPEKIFRSVDLTQNIIPYFITGWKKIMWIILRVPVLLKQYTNLIA